MKFTLNTAGCSDLLARLAGIGWSGVTMSWIPEQPGKGTLERLVG